MKFFIKVLGWIEISTLITIFVTLIYIDRYPLILLFFPIPTAILGFFTIKLNPSARRLNLLLSPLIVITYACGLMMAVEFIAFILSFPIRLRTYQFNVLFIVLLIIHIIFFNHPMVKKEFETIKTVSK